ncbi:3D domain-containing protein [Acetivibrio straminisolvens]|uniref:Cell wall-binding protein n=1 Tax=Acetivibrio straminisolvens JCM 21531 TaxID=1294263 RepID=W4VA82_9FIRM|nr:3D domain-containing protein [Acetivibrio straminisolvens]GAE90086.1 cell wall-binding protein [Acetivibrio straminisolvens JCM 21531]
MKLSPLLENIKRYVSFKLLSVVVVAFIIAGIAGAGVYFRCQKEVVVNFDDKQFVVKTMKSTVREVLKQNGIKLGENDYISVPLDSKLQSKKDNVINIKSAVPVTVIADGQEIQLMTSKQTVREALEDDPVNLSHLDRVEGAEPDDEIVAGMKLKVVRVKQELVSQNEIIPCDVIRRENNSMDKGDYKVIKEGKDGVREKVYVVSYEDGQEVGKQLLRDTVVSEPQTKIVEYGTVLNYTTARGEKFRYKSVMTMKATAYTASYEDTGKTPDHPEFGITYTGVRARRGIVAVDPKVIPLGTKLYIEGIGGVPDYGYAVAADIGSAVKGNIIDLYMDDRESVKRWGVKKVRVYILYD